MICQRCNFTHGNRIVQQCVCIKYIMYLCQHCQNEFVDFLTALEEYAEHESIELTKGILGHDAIKVMRNEDEGWADDGASERTITQQMLPISRSLVERSIRVERKLRIRIRKWLKAETPNGE